EREVAGSSASAVEVDFECPPISSQARQENPGSSKDWTSYKGSDLKRPLTTVLKSSAKRQVSTPRRPAVRVLVSSEIAEKYNYLVNRRIELVENEIERAKKQKESEEQERKLKIRKLEMENRDMELEMEARQRERQLLLESLQVDVALKRRTF